MITTITVDTVLTIAMLLAKAAARYAEGADVAATLADKLQREGRRAPTDEEFAPIQAALDAAKTAEDAALARAQAEGR